MKKLKKYNKFYIPADNEGRIASASMDKPNLFLFEKMKDAKMFYGKAIPCTVIIGKVEIVQKKKK